MRHLIIGITAGVGVGLFLLGVVMFGMALGTQDASHTNACEARGWERESSRTTLCIDDHGYARTPDSTDPK